MGYRKFNVNGEEYLVAIGPTHTKIRKGRHGKSTMYLNSEWGTPVRHQGFCYSEDPARSNPDPISNYIIRPADIRGMILGVRFWQDYPCTRHPEYMITGLTVDPFDAEIHNKTTLVGNCAQCIQDSAWEI